MSKGMDIRKQQTKKAPTMTLKEKRAAKRAKKDAKEKGFSPPNLTRT